MAGPVTVDVLLFAALRDRAGVAAERVELGPGSTAEALWLAMQGRHPGLGALPDRAPDSVRVAINRVYASWESVLRDGDEVAFLPPVSGGNVDAGARVLVRLTTEPIDPHALEEFVRSDGDGAVCSFSGVVRDHNDGRAVTLLEYSAYAEMAEPEMERIAVEVLGATGARAIAMVHRLGGLRVGETSVVVCASAAHRAEAFAACRRGIDELKARAPIWKREHGPEGNSWVEPAR